MDLCDGHGGVGGRREADGYSYSYAVAGEEGDEEEDEEDEDPSIAFRVISSARGKSLTRKGASGAARRLAKMEPTVVSAVRRSVANMGEKSAPARTFCV